MNGRCPWCGRALDRLGSCAVESDEHPVLAPDQRIAALVRARLANYVVPSVHHKRLEQRIDPALERMGLSGWQARAALLDLVRSGELRVANGAYFLPSRGLG